MFPQNHRNEPGQGNFQNNPPKSSSGSAEQLQSAIRSMDSGLYCRLCFAPTTNHVTSTCPHTAHNDQSFIGKHDANYRRGAELGLIPRIRRQNTPKDIRAHPQVACANFEAPNGVAAPTYTYQSAPAPHKSYASPEPKKTNQGVPQSSHCQPDQDLDMSS